jgi:hypothetical protein
MIQHDGLTGVNVSIFIGSRDLVSERIGISIALLGHVTLADPSISL